MCLCTHLCIRAAGISTEADRMGPHRRDQMQEALSNVRGSVSALFGLTEKTQHFSQSGK